jgi:transposase
MSTTTTTRNAGKVFSDRAVNFLIGNAGLMSAKSIAGRLGRTTKAVRRKAEKLGLSLSVN